jgi:hypothetical protein
VGDAPRKTNQILQRRASAKGYARESLQIVENTNRVLVELDQAKGNGFAAQTPRPVEQCKLGIYEGPRTECGTGSSMSTCWAACLGNCSDKISREHVVSKALFLGDQVAVHGFSWCPEPKTIGLANLTAKILCTKHNSDLSELDSAAGSAFSAMREMMHLSNVRAGLKPHYWKVQRYFVDGPALERWFLKTLINLAVGGQYFIGLDSTEGGRPSASLVEICFGLRQFEEYEGLYSVARVGEEIQAADVLKFAPLIRESKYVSGGLFSFRGNRYLLFLEHASPPKLSKGLGLPGEDWSASQLNFHNKAIRETAGRYLSQVLHTKWAGD